MLLTCLAAWEREEQKAWQQQQLQHMLITWQVAWMWQGHQGWQQQGWQMLLVTCQVDGSARKQQAWAAAAVAGAAHLAGGVKLAELAGSAAAAAAAAGVLLLGIASGSEENWQILAGQYSR